ncbi:MAG: B12-binding domain-containing radical SAM protein, partial [Deltaproteobacteria bacterium]|nr:B12-binding domain-containing radical SAM protein [Deltaproteobacteria bacterium]
MRVVLCYAPPWKLPLPGARADFGRDGPPAEYREGDLDGDFYQLPYGLLALGAQALRAGHAVKVLNLSAFPWAEVERVVRALPADVWGFSAWTANRRGVALMADLVKRTHPSAHVVVGGPHATPLAPELLRHHPQIDSVVTGEGDVTFLELLGRVGAGEEVAGVPGTVARRGAELVTGPRRRNVDDLDELASPQDYFSTHILMTSRGCPWQCTFCGAETTWGRGFRGLSVPAVLDAIERALERLPVRMLQIKDDTFTANRKRVLELCAGIRARGLKFLWSCDTRVDVLTADLLREMRLAGCERLSLGVESGSDEVLERIHKRITRQEILEATRLARRYGIRVRYYMMLGNRGETAETFRQTLDFLDQARPDQYLFSCLSIYPGTLDFDDAEREGWLRREQYFEGDFQELKVPFDASPEVTAMLSRWFEANKGLRTVHVPTVDECRGVLAELGEHPPALAELAGALHRAGDLAGADAA